MRGLPRAGIRRERVRRAVVLMPNGLTLFNLFCGIYAIILASQGKFASAPTFIVLGGIADMLDGRVARATGTGSRFGEELDSLVDAISFGFAPALIMYLASPEPHGTWEWLLVFIFTSCAVMRLARFNVEQAGRKKTHFHGLPSPAAGLTLASYYWFRETPLYNQAIIFFTNSTLAEWPWPTILRGLMAVLAALMISDVPYPTVPSVGFRSIRKVLGTVLVLGGVFMSVVRGKEFIFPALIAYVLYGAVKWVLLGFLGKSATPDEVYGPVTGVAPQMSGDRRPSSRLTPIPSAVVVEPRREEPRDDRRPGEPTPSSRRKRRRRGGRGGSRPPGAGPQSAGPQSAGPQSAGPQSAGPQSAGPQSAGSHPPSPPDTPKGPPE